MMFGLEDMEWAMDKFSKTFNSPWELDGVRTLLFLGRDLGKEIQDFQFLWELDGVRTTAYVVEYEDGKHFQFPVGIRWCSDQMIPGIVAQELKINFQFPVGIRWCSDLPKVHCSREPYSSFNSPWELDDVRTSNNCCLLAAGK